MMEDEWAMGSPSARRRRAASYGEPFSWWGPVWTPPTPRTVIDLIHEEVMSTRTAALLWALLARGASIAVVAGPSGAGKTTVLTALLDFLPPESQRLYLRGCYESFAFLDDPDIDPARGVLLVNELSPHFPTYLWGSGVHQLFESGHRGFQIALTAHAATATEFVGSLTHYPLRVPMQDVGAISVVLTLTTPVASSMKRPRLAGLSTLTPVGGTYLRVDPLLDVDSASPDAPNLAIAEALTARLDANERRQPHQTPSTGAEPLAQELARRVAALEALRRGGRPAVELVTTTLAAWQGGRGPA